MPEITNSVEPISVEVADLVKRFGSFVAVDQINLEVRKGEVFGFMGYQVQSFLEELIAGHSVEWQKG